MSSLELRFLLVEDLAEHKTLDIFEERLYRAAAVLTLRGEAPDPQVLRRSLLTGRLTGRFRQLPLEEREGAIRGELEAALDGDGDAEAGRFQVFYGMLQGQGAKLRQPAPPAKPLARPAVTPPRPFRTSSSVAAVETPAIPEDPAAARKTQLAPRADDASAIGRLAATVATFVEAQTKQGSSDKRGQRSTIQIRPPVEWP